MRRLIPGLMACICLLSIAAAQNKLPSASTAPATEIQQDVQDFSETVVPITSLKITPSMKVNMSAKLAPTLGMEADFGTGFCLDPQCGLIVTNYHVAVAARVRKIEGQKVDQPFLATGLHDQDATANYIPNVGAVAYATKRDLAIFVLRHYPPHHHGIGYSLDELHPGQQVDLYGYPKGLMNPKRKLIRLPAVFTGHTTSGLIAFDYDLSAERPLRLGGASGGIVVDRKTEKIVGVLCGTNDTTAVAVPVQTLLDFLNKVDPYLAEKIFPASRQIPSITADLYPEFVPPRSATLEHRPEEPHDVQLLREKAQLLADNIRNFVAVETYAWGSGNGDPYAEAAYEVQVMDGSQRFRRDPDGKKHLQEVPPPSHVSGWVLPADEWSQLPKSVSMEYRLKIHHASDSVIHGQPIKVFQYYADVEDDLCGFQASDDFGVFTVRHKPVDLACYGEVWTDNDLNIVRISENLDFLKPNHGWEARRVVVTYGWLKREDEPSQLVPETIYVEGRDTKKHIYWCRGYFKDYRVFSAKAKLAAN